MGILKQLGTAFLPDLFSTKAAGDIPPIHIDPRTHTTPNGEGNWFFEYSAGNHKYFQYKDYNSCITAYLECPTVSAILNRKAQMLNNGITWVLNTAGKESATTDAQKIRKLLANPNPIQSGRHFEAETYLYFQLFGFAIILMVKPFGYDAVDTKSMWNIPASWIDYETTQEEFTRSGGTALKVIYIKFKGKSIPFKLEDLLIIRDFSPSFTTITLPSSKLRGCAMPINNIIGALESRNVLINNRGPLGILSGDPGKGQYAPVPLTEPQKAQLQKDFRQYGVRRHQLHVIMTNAALKWQSMGVSTKDLLLMEECQESSKMICDVLNFAPHLLGLIDPTFNNQELAEKNVYTNAVIPDAVTIYDHYNKYFRTSERNINITKDFSKIEVLQKDKVREATARRQLAESFKIEWDMDLITMNQMLERLGEDTIPGGDIRRSQVPQSAQPIGLLLGQNGVQGLLAVVTNQSMSVESRRNTLEILFGISPNDAARMVAEAENGEQGQQAEAGSQQESEEESDN